MSETTNEAASIIDAVERLHGVTTLTGTSVKQDELALAVVPKGMKVKDLQPFLDATRIAPRRIEASAGVTSIASFADYVNRFKTTDSAIFVNDNPAKPSLLAIIDFHGQGDTASPRFGKHRAHYGFPLSDQIKGWTAVSGQPLSHTELATLIADRQYDISNPPLDWMAVDPATLRIILDLLNLHDDGGDVDDGAADDLAHDEDDRYVPRSAIYKLRRVRFGSSARLIQMAKTVEIGVNAKTVEGYSPKTGERTVTFQEEHDAKDGAGRKIAIPDGFLLRVPVWEGETPQLIPARLQYRRKDGALKWVVTLVEWPRVVRMAVKAEAEKVRDATGLPIFYGTP